MPGYIPSLGIAGVKIVNVHPGNPALGLPTVMALTIILDVNTGRPESILNATGLTDLRTGAAGAVAAKYLSPSREFGSGSSGRDAKPVRKSSQSEKSSPSAKSSSGAGIGPTRRNSAIVPECHPAGARI